MKDANNYTVQKVNRDAISGVIDQELYWETIEETKEQMAGIETTAPKYTDLKFNDIAGKVDSAAIQYLWHISSGYLCIKMAKNFQW